MSIPRLERNSSMATAVTVERNGFALEPVRVLDGAWVVRRDGRLVPLDLIAPEPDALILIDGRVLDCAHRQWPSLRAFLLDHGLDITSREANEAERAGRVRPYRYRRGLRQRGGSDTGLAKTLARGSAQRRRAA